MNVGYFAPMTISIIIPVYNAAPYITQCIESLVRQKQKLQVIVVDDGSTDDSVAIVRQLAAKYPSCGIEVYEQVHVGQAAARNLGLQHARGEYIAFVDADDYLSDNWIEEHLAAIDDVDFVQSGYQRVDGNKKLIGSPKLPLFLQQFTSACMRLYRRRAIEKIRFREGYIYEDVLFSIDLWLSGAKGKRFNYIGYFYTLNPQSTTSRPNLEDRARLFEALHQRAKTADLRGKLIIYYTCLRLKLHYLTL